MEISTFQLRIDEGLRTVAVLTNKLNYDVVGDTGVLVNVLYMDSTGWQRNMCILLVFPVRDRS